MRIVFLLIIFAFQANAQYIENIVAGEALSGFDAVYIHTDGKAYKADADAPANPAIGFVIAGAAIDVSTQIAFDGVWDFETGLDQGETAYLSTTAGDVTGTRPTNGQILGYVVASGRFKIIIQPQFTPVSVADGGTGAATLTGILQGNGTSAVTTITNSTTVGQTLRVTGSNTYAFGALDLADADAVTGVLPFSNGGQSITTGRATGQTAANSSVATVTVGGADATYEVSANVNVTTSSSENFNVNVAYTDETNTARTIKMSFYALDGTISPQIRFVNGAGPYGGVPMHIRCKASTSITITTTGTFTGATYNVEGKIILK